MNFQYNEHIILGGGGGGVPSEFVIPGVHSRYVAKSFIWTCVPKQRRQDNQDDVRESINTGNLFVYLAMFS